MRICKPIVPKRIDIPEENPEESNEVIGFKNTNRIMEMMMKDPSIGVKRISRALGISQQTCKDKLKRMAAHGLLTWNIDKKPRPGWAVAK